MDIKAIEFSSFAIYYFLLLAVILFFVFRLLHKTSRVLPFRPGINRKISGAMPMLELACWIVYFVWGIQFFSHNNHLYSGGLFVILILLALWFIWQVFKDFIAGAIFRISKDFNKNEIIRIGEYKGKIEKFGLHELILETEAGEHIYLPYSSLSNKAIIKSNPAEMIRAYTFRLLDTQSQNISEAQQSILKNLISLPWTSLTKTPQLSFRDRTQNGLLFEVTFYTYEPDTYFKTIDELSTKYQIITSRKDDEQKHIQKGF